MKLDQLPWTQVHDSLNRRGFATISSMIDSARCDELISRYSEEHLYRKTVVMERHRFGLGEYKYFDYPLPDYIEWLRGNIYRHLVPVANAWMRTLKIDRQYPANHELFLKHCHDHGQEKATPLILKYGKGGYNTLHQDLYGEEYFPLQMVLFLSDDGKDYEGGEFVITEQVPRAQSKASVIKPKKGDAMLFATSSRPVMGSRGYYRANLRHGVSEVLSGSRYTLGIIFHDAKT